MIFCGLFDMKALSETNGCELKSIIQQSYFRQMLCNKLPGVNVCTFACLLPKNKYTTNVPQY